MEEITEETTEEAAETAIKKHRQKTCFDVSGSDM